MLTGWKHQALQVGKGAEAPARSQRCEHLAQDRPLQLDGEDGPRKSRDDGVGGNQVALGKHGRDVFGRLLQEAVRVLRKFGLELGQELRTELEA